MEVSLEESSWFKVKVSAIIESDGASLDIFNDCSYTYSNEYDFTDECLENKCGNVSIFSKDEKKVFKYFDDVNEIKIFICDPHGGSKLMDSTMFPVTLERFDSDSLIKKILGMALIAAGSTRLILRHKKLVMEMIQYLKNKKSQD